MGYKQDIAEAMRFIGNEPDVRFVGYGLYPGGANGTLKDIDKSRFIEMPVSENLMSGMAIGLSLTGCTPVIYYERFDFVLNALDAIVNHLDKLHILSSGSYKPCALIRCFVGGKDVPLYTGPTHTQDFTEALRSMVNFPVIRAEEFKDVQAGYLSAYKAAKSGLNSTIIVEQKELL